MPSLGARLCLSTVSNTQQQANLRSFSITIPAFILSGFAYPISNMPIFVQYLTYSNPIRYFMEIVRGIFLKAAGYRCSGRRCSSWEAMAPSSSA